MAFIASAIGSLVGAGVSIFGATQQARAARQGAQLQADAAAAAEKGINARFQQAVGFLFPYQQYGLQAGATLSRLFTSPAEQKMQRDLTRITLESQRDRYAAKPGQPQSPETARLYDDYATQLDAFDKQTAYLEQTRAQGPEGLLASSPAYDYASQLTDRALAARGLLGSGEAIRQQGSLAAQLFGQQVSGLQNLYGTGARAAESLATGAQQTGQTAGQAILAGGQARAGGRTEAAAAWQQGLTGVASAVGGGINTALSFYNTNKLVRSLAEANRSRDTSAFDRNFFAPTPII